MLGVYFDLKELYDPYIVDMHGILGPKTCKKGVFFFFLTIVLIGPIVDRAWVGYGFDGDDV